jgi:hypothetical protein
MAIPVTGSVVIGYRLAVTPDRLVGRVESERSNTAPGLAPFGPRAAGLLLSAASARMAILAFAAVGVLIALLGTLSPAIRNRPSPSAPPDRPSPRPLPLRCKRRLPGTTTLI